MRARLLVVTLVLCSGCYESHTRRSPVDAGSSVDSGSPVDAGSPVDGGPPRLPHPCALAPIELAEVGALDFTGTVRVVTRGADYAVAWSSSGDAGGLVILTHDGRAIVPDSAREARADVVALEDGYLLTQRYGDTFWRVSAEGEAVGAPMVLPDIVPPHWQSLERHGDPMHFVAHPRRGGPSGEPHVYELDLAAWTHRRSPFTLSARSLWSFASDRALVVARSAAEVPELVAHGQRLRPDGTSEIVFESPLGSWRATDARFDPWTESWLVVGSSGPPDPRAMFARVSATGALVQQATFEPDAELAALLAAADGVHVAVAPSPIGPALAINSATFDDATITNVTIAYPPAAGAVFSGDLVLGAPSVWEPAIVWSDADAGFAVVTVDRDESGRAFLALRCGLRPE